MLAKIRNRKKDTATVVTQVNVTLDLVIAPLFITIITIIIVVPQVNVSLDLAPLSPSFSSNRAPPLAFLYFSLFW